MPKTDEKVLRQQLKASGLDASTVDRLVKSEIAEGNCEPRTGPTVSIKLDDLIEASKGLAAAANVPTPEVETSNALRKSGAMVDAELSEVLRANAANVESILEYLNETNPALVKGVHAQGVLVEQLVDAVSTLGNEVDALKKGYEALRGAPPGAPRGRPAPHPNDDAKGKTTEGPPPARISRPGLQKALVEEQSRLIKSGGDSKTILTLGQAVSALENSNATPEQILKRFDIQIGE